MAGKVTKRDSETALVDYMMAKLGLAKFDEVRRLVESGAEINVLNSTGQTALGLAATHGLDEIVSFLVDRGGDIEIRDSHGATPFHDAVLISCLSHTQSTVSLFISLRCNISPRDNHNSTPLHTACSLGYIDIVRKLMDNKADLYVLDDNEHTPMDVAKQENHRDVIALFKEFGYEEI